MDKTKIGEYYPPYSKFYVVGTGWITNGSAPYIRERDELNELETNQYFNSIKLKELLKVNQDAK